MTTSETTVPDLTPPASEPPTQYASGRRLVLITVSLLLAIVPLQLDALVAATALPTIAGDLGGFDRIAWIAAAFLLTMAIGTIAAGRIGDMFGRKRVLLVALVTFFAGSLWSGLAGSMDLLVAARALQGLGAGMTFTTLLAVVADVVPPERRSRYQALLGAIAPVSMLVGPWVGGLITEHLGWRWIFLLNLPLVGLSILGAAVLLHVPAGRRTGRVDIAGLVALAFASAGVVLAVTWGGHQYAWGSWQVLGAIAVAVVALAALVVIERRAEQPVLPPDLVRNRAVAMSFVVVAITTGAIMTGAMNYLPLFLQLVQGHSASNSGLLLLPLLLPALAVAMISGAWTTTAGRFRPAMVAGTAVVVVGSALLASMGTGTAGWVTAAFMVLVGMGLGLLFQTPLVLVQNSAPAHEVGAATGAAMFMRTLGGAIGVGAFGAVFSSTVVDRVGTHAPGVDVSAITPDQLAGLPAQVVDTVRSAIAAGSSAMFWVAAAIAVVAFVAAVAVPRVAGRRGAADAEPAVDEAADETAAVSVG